MKKTPHRSMLLENFKLAHFPYSINLLSNHLIQDSVLTFTWPGTKEIHGTKYLCVSLYLEGLEIQVKLKSGRAKKQKISNMITTLKQGMFVLSMSPGHCLFF